MEQLDDNSFIEEVKEFLESYVITCNLSKNNKYHLENDFSEYRMTFSFRLYKTYSISPAFYIRIEEDNFVFGFDERNIKKIYKTLPIWKEIKFYNVKELKQKIIEIDKHLC